jgi:hypothetical protein
MFTFPWFRQTICSRTHAGTSGTRNHNLCYGKGKGKAILIHAWTGPEGFRSLRLPDFKKINAWRWQSCQPYSPTAFTCQEIFLVLITESTPEIGPMTPSGIEPTTFRLEAQLRYRVHHNSCLTIRASQFAHHNSCLTIRASQFVLHNSCITIRAMGSNIVK